MVFADHDSGSKRRRYLVITLCNLASRRVIALRSALPMLQERYRIIESR
jgi:hypothetical protein